MISKYTVVHLIVLEKLEVEIILLKEEQVNSTWQKHLLFMNGDRHAEYRFGRVSRDSVDFPSKHKQHPQFPFMQNIIYSI